MVRELLRSERILNTTGHTDAMSLFKWVPWLVSAVSVGKTLGEEQDQDQGRQDPAAKEAMSMNLEGRVFERLSRYQELPEDVKAQTDAVGTYLLTTDVKQRVFTSKDWLHLTSALCVRGKNLVDAILDYLKTSNAEDATLEHANVLAEALVLSGFLAPIKEKEERKEMFVGEKDYLELLVDPALQENKKKTSVWQVADGAECAGQLVRVRNNMFGIKVRKEVYAVVNVTKHKSICFFASDVARDIVGQIELENAVVEYVRDENAPANPEEEGKKNNSSNALDFAIRISKDKVVEQLVFETKQKQDLWMMALVKAGAVFQEEVKRVVEKTLFDLSDTDLSEDEVSMAQFKGKVLLMVNVASMDDLAEQHFAELRALQQEFGEQGFEVLAFACDQFGSKEPNFGNDLMTELTNSFQVNFKVFDRRDVNGPDAREVFLFLKQQKPFESKGPFVEWNFVKFLVNRSGQVVSRHDARVTPAALEDEIKELLGETSPTAAAAATKEMETPMEEAEEEVAP